MRPTTFSLNRPRSPTRSGTSRIRTDQRGHSTSKLDHFAKRGDGLPREDASMSKLRIFSYLPNPRIWKATIAARLAGVDVEIRGSSPRELQSCLWDFDARPLSEHEQATSADTTAGK